MQKTQVKESIRQVMREKGIGENQRIYISDIQAVKPPQMSKAQFDKALLGVQSDGDISLYELNDPRELTPARKVGEVLTPSGNRRHIVYAFGRGS